LPAFPVTLKLQQKPQKMFPTESYLLEFGFLAMAASGQIVDHFQKRRRAWRFDDLKKKAFFRILSQ
jgi:hypothetical protein